jgi:hypothetical protein
MNLAFSKNITTYSFSSLPGHCNLTIAFTLLRTILLLTIAYILQFGRTFAEVAVQSAPSDAKSKPPGKIAGFFSRVSSFFVGAGLTALVTQYYIFEELRDGNKIMLEKQKGIEKRLKVLEK